MATLCNQPSHNATENNILDEATFEQHLSQISHLPWLQDIKRKHWSTFQTLDLPQKKQEAWRFSSLSRISLDGFHLQESISDEDKQRVKTHAQLLPDTAAQAIFADNCLVEEPQLDEALSKQGVIFCSLATAFEKHQDLLKQYFLEDSKPIGMEKFTSLNTAFSQSGTFLYVPAGVSIEKPFLAYHYSVNEGASLFPHTLIVAEDNSRVTLLDYLGSLHAGKALSDASGHIHAGPQAKVSRQVIQNFNEASLSFQSEDITAKRDSQPTSILINLGAHYARVENQVRIQEAGADVKMYGLTISSKQQEFDQRTLQTHLAPHATSDLLFKNALMDKSRTIFSGMIQVGEDAQQTDAYQTNRNLLLSDSVEANALPGLEILANDVKCSHGATSGKLDESELFYMLSRGISKAAARQLLVFGFFEEILEKIEDKSIAACVRDFVHQKFDTLK